MDLIRLEGVAKAYEKSGPAVLKNTSLVINNGDYISIRGVSGSGKSTLLYIIGGLLSPTTGRLLFNDQNVYSMKDNELSAWRGKNVGYIFQNIQLIQALTVRENFMLARRFGNDQSVDIDQWILDLGLESVADRLPGKLSGGQKRRAMIGCVMVRNPKVILADEPTNDLDSEWAKKTIAILEKRRISDSVLILVTHDPVWANRAPIKYTITDGKLTRG